MGTTLHTLSPPPGARRRRKRVGRGIGSGRGKTSTRGQKGQLARTNKMPVRFEGGQNPIHRRVPKRGFINIHRVPVHGVNVGRLEGAFAAGEEVTPEALHAKGLIPKKARIVKLLGDGEFTTSLKIKVHRVSQSARDKVEALGGSIELIVTGKREQPAN
jgi:large subunit ribosomal protein L15